MNPIVKGIVESSGKFKPESPTIFKKAFSMFIGKKIEIVVREQKTKRSNEQNSYLWAVPYKMIAEYTGHTKDEIHDEMRSMFLVKPSKVFKKVLGSTKKLSTKEFEEYTENIRRWADMGFGLYIPKPNEVDISEY